MGLYVFMCYDWIIISSASGLRDREWSAPPSCDTGGGQGEDVSPEGGEEGEEEQPHPLPSSLTYSGAQVTSAPTSPSHEDPSGLARSVFRSSKLSLPAGAPGISFGFLRSR